MTGEGDLKPMARQALKELLENRLDQEMTQYLGASHYEHASNRHDYRNGHYVRHLLTDLIERAPTKNQTNGCDG